MKHQKDCICIFCEQKQKDAIYEERNRVVAALSKVFRSWIGYDKEEPDWFIVYIELPTGQVSWHFPNKQRDLVSHLHDGETLWDGHTTEEKYARLSRL